MGRGAGNAPVPRFGRAFSGMDVAINHLKVGQSPKIEQSRPGRVSVFAPDPEQPDAMVNFGIPPQRPTALRAPPTLHPSQRFRALGYRFLEHEFYPRGWNGDWAFGDHGLHICTAAEAVAGCSSWLRRALIPPVRVVTFHLTEPGKWLRAMIAQHGGVHLEAA